MAYTGTESSQKALERHPRWSFRERASALIGLATIAGTLVACGPGESGQGSDPQPTATTAETTEPTREPSLEPSATPSTPETQDTLSIKPIENWSDMSEDEKTAAVNEYLRSEPLTVNGEAILPSYDMDGIDAAEYVDALLTRLFELARNGGYTLSQQVIDGITAPAYFDPDTGNKVLDPEFFLASQTSLAGQFGPDMLVPESSDPDSLYGWAVAVNPAEGTRLVSYEGRSNPSIGQTGNDWSGLAKISHGRDGNPEIYFLDLGPITTGQGTVTAELTKLWSNNPDLLLIYSTANP